jgi:hypothetical protein
MYDDWERYGKGGLRLLYGNIQALSQMDRGVHGCGLRGNITTGRNFYAEYFQKSESWTYNHDIWCGDNITALFTFPYC